MTGANALVSDVSEAHRGIALNLVNLFFGLGGLTTPFLSANLFARNWVRLCYTVASLTVVTPVIQAANQNASAEQRRVPLRCRCSPQGSRSSAPLHARVSSFSLCILRS